MDVIALTILLLATIGACRVVKVSAVGVRLALAKARTAMVAVCARGCQSSDTSMTTLALCALVAVLVAMRGSK